MSKLVVHHTYLHGLCMVLHFCRTKGVYEHFQFKKETFVVAFRNNELGRAMKNIISK